MLVALVAGLVGEPAVPAVAAAAVVACRRSRIARRRRRLAGAAQRHRQRVRRALRHGSRRAADPGAGGPGVAARQGRRVGARCRACCAMCSSPPGGCCRGSRARLPPAGAARPSASSRSRASAWPLRPSSRRTPAHPGGRRAGRAAASFLVDTVWLWRTDRRQLVPLFLLVLR